MDESARASSAVAQTEVEAGMNAYDEATALLMAARMLLSDEPNLIAGSFARDADGDDVPSYSRGAACWCSVGALNAFRWGQKLGDEYSADLFDRAVQRLARAIPKQHADKMLGVSHHGRCTIYSDNSSHARVLAWFDKAIES